MSYGQTLLCQVWLSYMHQILRYHAENKDKRNASENATAFDVGYYYMYTFITSMYLQSWSKTTISDVHCSLISDIFLKLKNRMLQCEI